MRFLAALPMVKQVLDSKGLYDGSLYIPASPNYDRPYQLGSDKYQRIITSDDLLYLSYHDTYKYMLMEGERFLSIDCNGGLVLGKYPHDGFSLKNVPGSGWKKTLYFKGDAEFQLCGDNSVAYKSNCQGAQNVTIIYELDWPIIE